MSAWKQSGLSAAAYAEQHDMHPSSLSKWSRSLLAARRAQQSNESQQFVPVEVRPGHPSNRSEFCGRLEVEFPAGHILRLTGPVDTSALADFLYAIKAIAC